MTGKLIFDLFAFALLAWLLWLIIDAGRCCKKWENAAEDLALTDEAWREECQAHRKTRGALDSTWGLLEARNAELEKARDELRAAEGRLANLMGRHHFNMCIAGVFAGVFAEKWEALDQVGREYWLGRGAQMAAKGQDVEGDPRTPTQADDEEAGLASGRKAAFRDDAMEPAQAPADAAAAEKDAV